MRVHIPNAKIVVSSQEIKNKFSDLRNSSLPFFFVLPPHCLHSNMFIFSSDSGGEKNEHVVCSCNEGGGLVGQEMAQSVSRGCEKKLHIIRSNTAVLPVIQHGDLTTRRQVLIPLYHHSITQ